MTRSRRAACVIQCISLRLPSHPACPSHRTRLRKHRSYSSVHDIALSSCIRVQCACLVAQPPSTLLDQNQCAACFATDCTYNDDCSEPTHELNRPFYMLIWHLSGQTYRDQKCTLQLSAAQPKICGYKTQLCMIT